MIAATDMKVIGDYGFGWGAALGPFTWGVTKNLFNAYAKNYLSYIMNITRTDKSPNWPRKATRPCERPSDGLSPYYCNSDFTITETRYGRVAATRTSSASSSFLFHHGGLKDD